MPQYEKRNHAPTIQPTRGFGQGRETYDQEDSWQVCRNGDVEIALVAATKSAEEPTKNRKAGITAMRMNFCRVLIETVFTAVNLTPVAPKLAFAVARGGERGLGSDPGLVNSERRLRHVACAAFSGERHASMDSQQVWEPGRRSPGTLGLLALACTHC